MANWYRNPTTGGVSYGYSNVGNMSDQDVQSFLTDYRKYNPSAMVGWDANQAYDFGVPNWGDNVSNSMVDSYKLGDTATSYAAPKETNSVAPTTTTSYQPTDKADLFQPDLYPYSKSTSGSINTSDSFSGLDEATRNTIIRAMLPNLIQSAQGAMQAPDRFEDTASKAYERQARQAIEESSRDIMEQMGRRGMMNSSVSEEALRGAISDIARSVGDKRYESGLDAEQMRLALPSIMSNLMSLGQYSQGGGAGISTSESISEQPNVPYENMMNFILGLSPTLVSG